MGGARRRPCHGRSLPHSLLDRLQVEFLFAKRARCIVATPRFDTLAVEVVTFVARERRNQMTVLESLETNDALLVFLEFTPVKDAGHLT